MTKILTVLTVICTASAVSAADVIVRLYSGTTTDQYTDYPVESAEEAVNNRAWNASRPVAFYVHGIEESLNSESTTTIVDAFLKHGDYNVMAIDYAFQAKYSGFLPRALAFLVIQSAVVGESMGQLLYRLVAKGVPVSSFYLIGYSIGAHIAGHAARSVGGLIPRITALDPILHGWFLFSIDDHLWKTDAEVVDVIHSNGVVMGVSTAIGTADFYPNNGYALQPGCPLPVNVQSVLCSSDVAWKWFAESVNNPKAFKAIACNSWAEFKAGACEGETDNMGYGHSENATGVFYLQTNGASPYSKGNNGIIYDGSADRFI